MWCVFGKVMGGVANVLDLFLGQFLQNSISPMTTEQQEHCGLKSLSFPPMSCRGRAEAFASSLQSRLRSLASLDTDISNEPFWSTNQAIISTSPLQPSDSEIFLNYIPCETPVENNEDHIHNKNLYYINGHKSIDLNENAINHAIETDVCERLEETEDIFINTNIACITDGTAHDFCVVENTTECFCSPIQVTIQKCDRLSDIKAIASTNLNKTENEVISTEIASTNCTKIRNESSSEIIGTYNDTTANEAVSSITRNENENEICSLDIELVTNINGDNEITSNTFSLLDATENDVISSDIDALATNKKENAISSLEIELITSTNGDTTNNEDASATNYAIASNKKENEISVLNKTENEVISSEIHALATNKKANETNPSTIHVIATNKTANETNPSTIHVIASTISNETENKYHSSVTEAYTNGNKTETEITPLEIHDISSNNEVSSSTCTSDNEDEVIIPRVRRCSSLKTGKTPPDTPGRKKIVRFADVLGLDLADVRTFLDDIPKIPNSAYHDLLNADVGDVYGSAVSSQRTLLALFQQPGGMPNFLDMVQINYVMLENAVVDDPISFSVRGWVRVRNLDFNKSVYVRYSLDAWQSFSDLQAVYVENSCDGFSDKFGFLLYAYSLNVGQRLEFAVRFNCKGVQYWDNNAGANYCFQCLPAANPAQFMPITTGLNEQCAAFCYMEEHKDPEDIAAPLSSAAVQDYIMNSLQKNKGSEITHAPRQEIVLVFLVVFFSMLLFYMRNVILF